MRCIEDGGEFFRRVVILRMKSLKNDLPGWTRPVIGDVVS